MSRSSVKNVRVRGVVCTIPGEPLGVEHTGRHFPEEQAKIAKTVGLKDLHRAASNQTAGDLCIAAAERLLNDLGWERGSIDAIIMVTQTPDHFLPATACIAHGKLGLPNTCLAFDVGMGCSGYVYGLMIASQFVAAGSVKRCLLLAGDTISKIASEHDQATAMVFGDAGSATALEWDSEAEPTSFVAGTDGAGAENIIVPAGGFRTPITRESAASLFDPDGKVPGPTQFYMDGFSVYAFTVQRVPPLVRESLAMHGWDLGDVNAFLFHQANAFILEGIAKKLKLDAARVPINIGRYGNTSMATIPLLLADDMKAPIASRPRTNLLLVGFGVGFSWAAAALTITSPFTAEVVQV